MKLESTIAGLMLKSLPKVIVRKVLSEPEFSAFLNVPLINFRGTGSFDHKCLLEALESARQSQGQVKLVARTGESFVLDRLPVGVTIASADGAEGGKLVPELNFLDSDKEVRLRALSRIVELHLSLSTKAASWRLILEERPFSEGEFRQLLSDIQNTPEQFLTSLELKWRSGGNMTHASFFPMSRAYYEALIGPPCDSLDAWSWIDDYLIPYLRNRISESLSDGLKCALAINIDPRISLATLVDAVPAEQLLPTLRELTKLRSPLALLGVAEIAISRVNEGAEFGEIASEMLANLVGGKSEETKNVHARQMMPALLQSGLGQISVTGELWNLPLYWRKFAALAQASLIVERLDTGSQSIDEFIDWVNGQKTAAKVSAMLLDKRKDPLWNPTDLNSMSFKAIVVSRLANLKDLLSANESKVPNGHFVNSAFEAMKTSGSVLDMKTAWPIHNGKRVSQIDGVDKSNDKSLSGLFLDTLAELEAKPNGASWSVLARLSRLVCFEESLLTSLGGLLTRISVSEDLEERESFFEALACAAEISATQPCESLAEAAVSTLIREAGKLSGALESEAGFYILMLASGAILDDTKWRGWIEQQMSSFAFSVPKGEVCSQLLMNLDAVQTLLPLRDRCFGRARKFCSSVL